MRDLSIYFSDFDEQVDFKAKSIGARTFKSTNEYFQEPIVGSIALIFIPEYRNSSITPSKDWVSSFRKSFNALFPGDWDKDVFDLGTILPGDTYADTYSAVKEVVSELIKADVFPLLIGGSQDLTYAVYQAYEKLEQTINLLDVDPALDLGDIEKGITHKEWLNKIILHQPSYLFNYSLFGYQSYLVNQEELDLLDKLYFDSVRLGEFYGDEKSVEPLLRNADILSFDLNAIRSSDFKNNTENLPNGLYGEDACRIMRYAGMSDKLTSLGLFNFSDAKYGAESDVNLLSQMVWYFIEGFNLRKRDYPIGSKANYFKYRVSIDDFKDEIIFYKSDKSGRWWMEVPYPKLEGVKYQRHLLVPCNYSDYENALQNELPNLWLKAFKKLT